MAYPIIHAAEQAFRLRLTTGSDVSAHTRNAQAIAKAWRTACFDLNPFRFAYDVPVRPDFDQRIDVLDRDEMYAFEFKVSGKNASKGSATMLVLARPTAPDSARILAKYEDTKSSIWTSKLSTVLIRRFARDYLEANPRQSKTAK